MKRFEKTKGFILGVIVTLLTMTTIVPVLAANIDVLLNSVNIVMNGEKIATVDQSFILDNGDEVPFSIRYNGTTYLPLRKFGELYGKDIKWDGNTNTATINDKPQVEQPALPPGAYGYKIYINGVKLDMEDKNGDIEPFNYGGWIYAPVDHIVSALGGAGTFDGETKSLYIGGKEAKTTYFKQHPTIPNLENINAAIKHHFYLEGTYHYGVVSLRKGNQFLEEYSEYLQKLGWTSEPVSDSEKISIEPIWDVMDGNIFLKIISPDKKHTLYAYLHGNDRDGAVINYRPYIHIVGETGSSDSTPPSTPSNSQKISDPIKDGKYEAVVPNGFCFKKNSANGIEVSWYATNESGKEIKL